MNLMSEMSKFVILCRVVVTSAVIRCVSTNAISRVRLFLLLQRPDHTKF